ncbi:MAG: sigma 54-interacting transcriptional regulator [Acidobacteria bacterium]|nr:sigma 54-interacting transcriptional regulator [Acidobacteriota bacterium]
MRNQTALPMPFPYEVLEPLERSGNASVFRARDLRNSDLKVLTLLASSPSGETDLRKVEEAFDQRRSLEHPYLIRVEDLAYRHRRLGLISAFLRASPLKKARLHRGDRLNMGLQLCELVAYLHARDFYLGLLRPSQIYWSADGHIECNILFTIRRDEPRGGDLIVCRYSSPEYLEGGSITSCSDLYSLGMLLYLVFTGVPPFLEQEPDHLRTKQLFARPLSPRLIDPDLPAPLEELIVGLLEKNPLRRPSADYARQIIRDVCGNPPSALPRFRSVLVGRKREVEACRKRMTAFLSEPRLACVLVQGKSGVGKSALLSRMELAARLRGLETLQLRHHRGGKTITFQGLLEPQKSGKISRLPQKGTCQTLAQLLRERRRPLVLLLDDLQWMDEASFSAYRKLLSSTAAPLLMIAAARTDESSPVLEQFRVLLEGVPDLERISLSPLAFSDVTALTKNLLGSPPPEGLMKQLASQCAGNPFYLYERLRCIQERKELTYTGGRWHWMPQDLTSSDLPENVAEDIRSRLSSLSKSELDLLKLLSLLERPCSLALLSSVLAESCEKVADTLRFLESLDLVTLSGGLSNTVVQLSHDWVGQAVQTLLRRKEARELHFKIAGALEAASGGPEQEAILTWHFAKACASQKVQDHLWKAVRNLQKQHLYRDAAYLIVVVKECRALKLDSWEKTELTIEALYSSGKFDLCLEVAESTLAKGRLADSNRTYVFSRIAEIQLLTGNILKARVALDKALRLNSTEKALRIQLEAQLLCLLSRCGEQGESLSLAQRLLDSLNGCDCEDKVAHALCSFEDSKGGVQEAIRWEAIAVKAACVKRKYVSMVGRISNLSHFHAELGDLHQAKRFARYSLEFSRQLGNVEVAIFSQTISHIIDRKQGRHQQALQGLSELLVRNRQSNQNRHVEAEICVEIAKNLNYLVNPQAALQWLDQASQQVGEDPIASTLTDIAVARAWSYLLLGRPQEGLRLISELDWEKLVRGRVRFHLFCASAQLFVDNLEAARQSVYQALALLTPEAVYQRALTHLIAAEILLRAADIAGAAEHLQTAKKLCVEHFYAPLLSRCYLLQARFQLVKQDAAYARVLCKRSLQVARSVERPLLFAEIHRLSGHVYAVARNYEESIRHFGNALQILKERALFLSSSHRESFIKAFVNPVENERDDVAKVPSRPSSQYLIRLRDLFSELQEKKSLEEAAGASLAILRSLFPEMSACLLVQRQTADPPETIATVGRCRRSASDLIGEMKKGGPVRVVQGSPDQPLTIPLSAHGRPLGLLHVESHTRVFSEPELDFLDCLRSILELEIAKFLAVPATSRAARQELVLVNGTRLVGSHPEMQKLAEHVRKVAVTDGTVIVTGESGTGKELVARSIHELSPRRSRRFVPINCGGLTQELIENELFGHARGSYTGAQRDKAGLFEVASGGTMFLDEIGSMALELQKKLLRVLQQRQIRRIGETEERNIDVRIIAATNQRLESLVEQGQFREDLYHRLNVHQIEIPPLRERESDIPMLCAFFVDQLNRREKQDRQLSAAAMELLCRHQYPGNVRELENIVESIYHLSQGPLIDAEVVRWRLASSRRPASSSLQQRARELKEALFQGRLEFWSGVRDAFLRRDLSRAEIREMISFGLAACGGRYRTLLERFHMPSADYKKFISFLSNHDCKVDFRPYRQNRA